MKNLSILLTFLLLANYLQAQDKCALGLTITPTPDYNTSRKYYEPRPANGSGYRLSQPFGMTAMITANRKLGRHFWLSTGLGYGQVIEHTRDIRTFDFYGNRIPVYDLTTSYHSVKLPLLAYYRAGKSRVNFMASAGFLFSYHYRYRESFHYHDASIAYPDESRRRSIRLLEGTIVNFNAGTGILYQATDKLIFTFEPNAVMPITNLSDAPEFVHRIDPHSIGLRFGVMYNFR